MGGRWGQRPGSARAPGAGGDPKPGRRRDTGTRTGPEQRRRPLPPNGPSPALRPGALAASRRRCGAGPGRAGPGRGSAAPAPPPAALREPLVPPAARHPRSRAAGRGGAAHPGTAGRRREAAPPRRQGAVGCDGLRGRGAAVTSWGVAPPGGRGVAGRAEPGRGGRRCRCRRRRHVPSPVQLPLCRAQLAAFRRRRYVPAAGAQQPALVARHPRRLRRDGLRAGLLPPAAAGEPDRAGRGA